MHQYVLHAPSQHVRLVALPLRPPTHSLHAIGEHAEQRARPLATDRSSRGGFSARRALHYATSLRHLPAVVITRYHTHV